MKRTRRFSALGVALPIVFASAGCEDSSRIGSSLARDAGTDRRVAVADAAADVSRHVDASATDSGADARRDAIVDVNHTREDLLGSRDAAVDSAADSTVHASDAGADTGPVAAVDAGTDSRTALDSGADGRPSSTDAARADAGLDSGARDAAADGTRADAARDSAKDAKDATAPLASIFVLDDYGGETKVYGYPADGGGGNPTVTIFAFEATFGADIGVDGQGYVYVLDSEGSPNSIQVFAPTSASVTSYVRKITWTGMGLKAATDMSVMPDGTLFLMAQGTTVVIPPGSDGNVSPTRTAFPVEDDAGDVFSGTFVSIVGTSSGAFFLGAGGYGSPGILYMAASSSGNSIPESALTGPAGLLLTPQSMAIDPTTGDLVVDDFASQQQILVFSQGAAGTTAPAQNISVSGTCSPGTIRGVTVDSIGRIFVVASCDATSASTPVVDVFARGATGAASPVLQIVGGPALFRAPEGVATTL